MLYQLPTPRPQPTFLFPMASRSLMPPLCCSLTGWSVDSLLPGAANAMRLHDKTTSIVTAERCFMGGLPSLRIQYALLIRRTKQAGSFLSFPNAWRQIIFTRALTDRGFEAGRELSLRHGGESTARQPSAQS